MYKSEDATSNFSHNFDKKSTNEHVHSVNKMTISQRKNDRKKKPMLYTNVDSEMLQVAHVRQTSLMKVVDVNTKSECRQPTAAETRRGLQSYYNSEHLK